MARFRDVADDLRARIQSGEFPVGTRLPDMRALQNHYHVPERRTIWTAHQILVEEGMLTTHRDIGAVVTATEPLPEATLLAVLTHARDNLTTVLSTLTPPQPQSHNPTPTPIPQPDPPATQRPTRARD